MDMRREAREEAGELRPITAVLLVGAVVLAMCLWVGVAATVIHFVAKLW